MKPSDIFGQLCRVIPWHSALSVGFQYRAALNLLQYGDWYFPRSFYIEISEHCNRTCHYCPNVAHQRFALMTEQVFDMAARRLADLNWTGVVGFHMQNEPLLDKRFPRLLERLVSIVPNCSPTLVTNGDVLDEEYTAELILLGMKRILVSRHPPFSEEWDKKILGIKTCWPSVVNVMQPGITWPIHSNKSFGFEGIPWQGHCMSSTMACVITITGEVNLCCFDYFRKTGFGNVLNQSLRDIWFGEEFSRLRRELRQGKQAHPICDGCSGVI